MLKMRNLTLTLEGKIVIYKIIALSKIVFQSFITTPPKHIVNGLDKKQKAFYGKTLLLRQNMKLFVMNIKMED